MGSDLNKFFDKNKSISLEIANNPISIYSSNRGYYSNDSIHFITNTNKKIKKKISIYFI